MNIHVQHTQVCTRGKGQNKLSSFLKCGIHSMHGTNTLMHYNAESTKLRMLRMGSFEAAHNGRL